MLLPRNLLDLEFRADVLPGRLSLVIGRLLPKLLLRVLLLGLLCRLLLRTITGGVLLLVEFLLGRFGLGGIWARGS